MRTKQPAIVITFSTTTAAMATEQLCEKKGLPGRIIPTPVMISAECGLAWKAPPESRQTLIDALNAASIKWDQCTELML